mmetsp:Transcript_11685/g.11603  ORF Transcript_11685/g.11603 Transcript_11685/m.11603 type:complete len:111 (+) Transcript_11685:1-333(+)
MIEEEEDSQMMEAECMAGFLKTKLEWRSFMSTEEEGFMKIEEDFMMTGGEEDSMMTEGEEGSMMIEGEEGLMTSSTKIEAEAGSMMIMAEEDMEEEERLTTLELIRNPRR